MNTQVYQDKTYRWYLRSKPAEKSGNKINTNKQTNPLLSKDLPILFRMHFLNDNQGFFFEYNLS